MIRISIGDVFNTKDGVKVKVIDVCMGSYVEFEYTVFGHTYGVGMQYNKFLKIIK